MRGTWFVRFWTKLKAKTTRNAELGGRTISWILKGSEFTDLFLETPRSTARSGVIWYMQLRWDNLNEFEPCMSCIVKVKSRHMQNADRLWDVVSGFAKRILAIFSIADQDYRTACETWSNASLADVQRFPSPQTSPDAQCSRGPNGPDPGRGRPIWQSCGAC